MGVYSHAGECKYQVAIKVPGNPAKEYDLKRAGNGQLKAVVELPLTITEAIVTDGDTEQLTITIKANSTVYYNFGATCRLTDMPHGENLFLMPGFWYRRNLRSPDKAPSFHTSDSWQVREDRLSAPLTGVYNEKSKEYHTVLRIDDFQDESLSTHNRGEIILTSKTSIGYTGFINDEGNTSLVFGFPYHEAPKTYIRKLTLAPSVQAFEKMEKGETKILVWQLHKGSSPDFSDFVADTWNYCYDQMKPEALVGGMTADEAKKVLTNYFKESYLDNAEIKYFSGLELLTYDCKSRGILEVGFVGRVLLNAFNCLEYAEANDRDDLKQIANSIFDSFLTYGFTPNGFFREKIDFDKGTETDVLSIRRQSEGVYAVLSYLDYEKKHGRKHPEWETRIKVILDNFLKLQNADGSFPRKFEDNMKIVDASGGSTPSATLPLTMASIYFKDKDKSIRKSPPQGLKYLTAARSSADYLEKELIEKADYFSSTLDANCEDKEASLYAATAMYYMALTSTGAERARYVELCRKAAYFALSWYYMWDVPFAGGQMLGDAGFRSRGWGNVSVENNHVDVFIFEFGDVLNWLAKECNEPRFSEFYSVIRSSMLQLMPVEGAMFDIAKEGYYPEVVQHTNWDYGLNGKGFYNNWFAPGWTVASLWQLLTPDRAAVFLK